MADLNSSLPVRFGAPATTSGTITITSTSNTLALTVGSYPSASAEIQAGTAGGAGVLVFEATIDGTNWFAIDTYLLSTGATPATTSPLKIKAGTGLVVTSLPARVLFPAIGSFSQIRIRPGTAGTGTTGTITISASINDTTFPWGFYQEDSTHADSDLGMAVWAVRRDAGTALAGTGNDYIPFSTDLDGKLWTAGDVIDNDASNTYALGSDSFKAIGGFAVATNANPGTAITAGRGGVVAVSPNREVFTVIRDAAGNGRAANVDSSNRLQVAITGSSGATDLGKAEDAAHVSGDVGVMALGVMSATPGATPAALGTFGDYEPLQMDSQGSAFVSAAVNSRTDSRKKQFYETKASLAANTAVSATELDYTPSGVTFIVKQIVASASGKIKLQVQVGGSDVLVAFNSTANPNIVVNLEQPLEVGTGVKLQGLITNLESSAQDVYFAAHGVEI